MIENNKCVLDIIKQYKTDEDSVYSTWFINEDRLKCFRSIRKGLKVVISEMQNDTFGNDFKDSSLEMVLASITEQKQVFKGASHAFVWKPKLRIPDIYENKSNQRCFGQFLDACLNISEEVKLIGEVQKLVSFEIKGLGPAVSNILYFLHPTIFMPFNTAIVNGFNAIFHKKIKLGSWQDYLLMNEIVKEFNNKNRSHLSKDLGLLGGFLFEVGCGRVLLPEGINHSLKIDENKREKMLEKWISKHKNEQKEVRKHIDIQYKLIKLGNQLGYDVWVASNDRSCECNGEKFSFLTLNEFPNMNIPKELKNTIKLIDVIWFNKNDKSIQCAFEVECTTSIYSGILRLHDLSSILKNNKCCSFYLLSPKKRKKDVIYQLNRHTFKKLNNVNIGYIINEELEKHYESLMILGNDKAVLDKISIV